LTLNPVHIFLIHGTFASNAEWTNEGSDLRSAIRGKLPGHEIIFHVFKWSGKNSHRKRLEAGAALAEEIQGLPNNDENTNIFLIAHSHGGNVGLYALDQLNSVAVKGLVCLATPFFHVSEFDSQNLRTVVRLGLGFIWFLIWAVLMIGTEQAFPVSGLFARLGDLGDFLLGAGILVFITSTLSGGWSVISNLLQRARDKGEFLGQRLKNSAIEAPVLALAYRRDEPALWLNFLQVFDRLIRNPWERVVSIITTCVLDYGAPLFFGVILIGGISTWLDWDGQLPDDVNVPIEMLALFLTNSLWVIFVGVPIYLIIFYLMRSHIVGFGWDDLFLLGGWRIRVYAKPPEDIVNCQFEHITFNPGDQSGFLSLRHSHIYSDPLVHERICNTLIDALPNPQGR
jgi:pimeloyl-ACP methyl ester carboxylesterase